MPDRHGRCRARRRSHWRAMPHRGPSARDATNANPSRLARHGFARENCARVNNGRARWIETLGREVRRQRCLLPGEEDQRRRTDELSIAKEATGAEEEAFSASLL